MRPAGRFSDALERIPVFICMGVGVALLVLPFLERARTVHWSMRLLMIATGLLALEFGLLVLGILPRLLARIPGLRNVEPAKATLAFMILPMVPVTALAMNFDAPSRFPMGKSAAFGAMGTFFLAGVWLIVSGGPPTPKRQLSSASSSPSSCLRSARRRVSSRGPTVGSSLQAP